MAKRKLREHTIPDADVEMNMTPMIDIVFQMILFFIIITDFTQKDIALLELPWSTVGIEDEGEEEGRIIINITAPVPSDIDTNPKVAKKWPEGKIRKANKILIRGKDYNFVELHKFLEANGRENPNYRDPENPHLSTRSVLIRCDGDQAFDYVKAILQICATPSIAIYKIEIATSEQVSPEDE